MKTIRLQKIQFSNVSEKVICFGILNAGALSYESALDLNFSKLNLLLGKIGKQLGEDFTYEQIVKEETVMGDFYCLDLSDQNIEEFPLNTLITEGFSPIRISA